MKCEDGTFLTNGNETVLFSNCSGFNNSQIRILALARGYTGLICFLLCLITLVLELIYVCRISKKKSTTVQRLFIYLTASNLVYSAVLSLHAEHYYTYHSLSRLWCYFCKVNGFLDEYTGLLQLSLTLGIVVKLLHKIFAVYFPSLQSAKLARHHYTVEFVFVLASVCLPWTVVWVPFISHGVGEYGVSGPWCWIRVLQNNCHVNRNAFIEELLLWYIPFVVVSFISLLGIVTIVSFLVYFHFCHILSPRRIRAVILDLLLLLPFLIVSCCVCLVEIIVIIELRQQENNASGGTDKYILWMCYAISTPIGGVIIPIAFFLYFLREKKVSKRHRLMAVSNPACTVPPSDRLSPNSFTSQQERPCRLTHSDVEWETSTGSAVVVNSFVGSYESKYGAVNNAAS